MDPKQEEYSPERTDITDDDLQFISKYLNISDLEILRDHVFKIWSECTGSVWAYQCIKRLAFLKPRMKQHFLYQNILSMKENAKFLDLGCCFATDTRNLVMEGWKPENITAVDVVDDYWKFGLTLFKDSDSLKIQVLQVDTKSYQILIFLPRHNLET